MTIPANMPAYNMWNGNSSSVNFDFDFIIDKPDDLIVIRWNTSTNKRDYLSFGIDYTIAEISNQNGSFITYPANDNNAKLSADEKIILISNREIKQQYPFTSSGDFDMKTFEKALDYIVTLIKQISYDVGRAVKIPDGSDNKYSDEFLNEFFENITKAEHLLEQIELETDKVEEVTNKLNEFSNSIEFGVTKKYFRQNEWILNNNYYNLKINDKSVVLGVYKTVGSTHEQIFNADIETTSLGVVIKSIEPFNGFILVASNTVGEYVFEQVEPADEWIIEHNLGKYPSVTIVDNDGYLFVGQVKYLDLNTIKITFTEAVQGKVFLN